MGFGEDVTRVYAAAAHLCAHCPEASSILTKSWSQSEIKDVSNYALGAWMGDMLKSVIRHEASLTAADYKKAKYEAV